MHKFLRDHDSAREILRDMLEFFEEPHLHNLLDAVFMGSLMVGLILFTLAGFIKQACGYVRWTWRRFDAWMLRSGW